MIDCRYFDNCSAPLCPQLSETVLKVLFWFSDEPVCKNKDETPEWLERQRELKRNHQTSEPVKYTYSKLAKIYNCLYEPTILTVVMSQVV